MNRLRAGKSNLYGEAVRATLLGLGANLALGAAKLIGGFVGQSFALISDAVNSLGDVLTSLVVLHALHVAQKPADDEHPYGHTRAEAIAGSNVSILVIVSALMVGYGAIRGFSDHPHELPPTWTLAIAGANIAVKEALYRYQIRLGKKARSMAILANAWDHRADALSALAVLVGLLAILLGGERFLLFDHLVSLFVVAEILNSAVRLHLSSAQELMDAQADPAFVEEIRAVATAVEGVQRIDKLRVRKSGLEYFVDIHTQVDAHETVHEGHRISHLVKDELLNRFSNLRDVLVHLEPYPHVHDCIPQYSEEAQARSARATRVGGKA
ncbi:MAG: cation transporter [Planctomycetaceae bacterium]|nr:cation transporter [Planctomycetaceae bacterium]